MSRWCYEVQAAVDSVIWHRSAVHPRLCIQEVLAFTVDVVYNWLPTGMTDEDRHEADIMRKLDNKEHLIIWARVRLEHTLAVPMLLTSCCCPLHLQTRVYQLW